MRRLTPAILLVGLLGPGAAPAQEPPIPEPNIPDAPRLRERTPPPAPPVTPRITKDDYPIELIYRPLTLAALQAEVALSFSFMANDGNSLLWPILRAAFGITPDWEVGITYSPFLGMFDAPPGEDAFQAGRGFSIDGGLTLIPDWLATRLRLAFYADPDFVGFGLIAGVPFRWRILPRFALFAGHDLLYIKVAKLAVDPADPARNLGEVSKIERDIPTDSGRINLSFGAIWQVLDSTALVGTFAIGWEDFSFTDQPYSLYVGVTHALSRRFDLTARTGFRRLEEASTFTLEVGAALRI